MDHHDDGHFNRHLYHPNDSLNETNFFETILNSHSHLNFPNPPFPLDHAIFGNNFPIKKRETLENQMFWQQNSTKQEESQSKAEDKAYLTCSICIQTDLTRKVISCQSCNRLFHVECLISKGNFEILENYNIQCSDCKMKARTQVNLGFEDLLTAGSSLGRRNEYIPMKRANFDSETSRQNYISPHTVLNSAIPNVQKLQILAQLMKEQPSSNELNQLIQTHPMLLKILSALGTSSGQNQNLSSSGSLMKNISPHTLSSFSDCNYNKPKPTNQNDNGWSKFPERFQVPLLQSKDGSTNNFNIAYNNLINFNNCDNTSTSGNPLSFLNNTSNMYENTQYPFKAIPIPGAIPMKIQKYPIEDTLLLSSPAFYEINLETFHRPAFHPMNIPPKLTNKVVIIWDFLLSFQDNFNLPVSEDVEVFYKQVESHSQDLFELITCCLVHFLIKSLNQIDIFPQEKDLYIAKGLIENLNLNSKLIMKNCWKWMLKVILNSCKFSYMLNEELKTLIENFSNGMNVLNNEEKIQVMFILVNSTYESQSMKDQIKRETENKLTWEMERSSYEDALRENEKRKKEIMRSEKFINAAFKIEMINKKLEEFTDNPAKNKSSLEMEREKYRNFLKENDTLDSVKNQIIEKLSQVQLNLKQLKFSRKRLLGSDVYKNEYYFFPNIFNKIFIKEKKTSTWNYYDKQEELQELIDKLTEKGIREKKLKYLLKKTMSDKMNFDIAPKANNSEIIPIIPETKSWDLASAAESLIKIDEKFSEYLSQYEKEWESPEKRIHWRNVMITTSNMEYFIVSLRMLNHRFKNPYKMNEPSKTVIVADDTSLVKYSFLTGENASLDIFEYDPTRLLSPKVKIWSKDLEANGIDKYFPENLLNNILTREMLFFAIHFFEYVIFSLLKRRETAIKRNSNIMKDLLPIEMENSEEESNDDKEAIEAVGVVRKIVDNITPAAEQEKEKIIDEEQTLSIPMPSEKSSSEKKRNNDRPKRKKENEEINEQSISEPETRKKRIRPRKQWKDTCYICGDYGKLICCEGCSNVVHLFCACLSVK